MGSHLQDTLIPLVKNLLLLNAEGKRVAVKYYDNVEWCGPSGACALMLLLTAFCPQAHRGGADRV